MAPTPNDNLPPILPVGTAVVTRAAVEGRGGKTTRPRGSVGVIVRSPADPDHSYRVRFVGGEMASLRRGDLDVLSHYQAPARRSSAAAADGGLYRWVIYRCVVGSRAYGLEGDESDFDRRGIYLAPAEMHWSLFGVPPQLEDPEADECYWELQRFLTLALKANPNVLEVLNSPIVEHATELAKELLAMRGVFLSRLVYQTYNGYVLSQFKKLQRDIRTRGGIKWKHAMHLIRLLLSGITVLRDGVVPVRVAEHREALLAVRNGEMSWEQVDAWRLKLHEEFEAAFETTSLPERPDYEAANAFLIKARRSMVT